jgi:phosphoserine aminotransferase
MIYFCVIYDYINYKGAKMNKPNRVTNDNRFGSGPCKKRPNWKADVLKNACVGRSHKSVEGKKAIKEILDLQGEILQIPDGYVSSLIMGSDTGAFEAALWNLVGERGVDSIVYDYFGKKWKDDIAKRLNIKDYREFISEYGYFPDISGVDGDRDAVFCYNGTTSGSFINNLDFIKKDRKGLTFCDATSAAFAYDVDWSKIDIFTYSWQKVLGGEAGHGILILSPRALDRIKNYTPNWPIPSFLDLKNKSILENITINTPSLLCIEDFKDALLWIKNNGGLQYSIDKTKENSNYLYDFIEKSKFLRPFVFDKQYRSSTSVTFVLKDNNNEENIKKVVNFLAEEKVAFDIKGHREVSSCFRVWCGPTVELEDIKILCEWLEYAVENIIN